MLLSLLLIPACDPKFGGESTDGGDSWAGTTAVSSSGAYSASGDTESVTTSSATHPCLTSDPGDTETPAETTESPAYTSSSDTETPVGSTSTSGPGGDTEGSSGEVFEDEACGWGAGGDEAGTWCALSITCRGQPERAMQCDTRTCICLVGGVEVGSCDAEEVCLDLGHVQDKGPACCGFPALSP